MSNKQLPENPEVLLQFRLTQLASAANKLSTLETVKELLPMEPEAIQTIVDHFAQWAKENDVQVSIELISPSEERIHAFMIAGGIAGGLGGLVVAGPAGAVVGVVVGAAAGYAVAQLNVRIEIPEEGPATIVVS
jgi:hypothetical protein